MIGPVSTTGRAMMASLQQAIDKGMPPDQAIQYVKGMATQGIAPLADLYSMMNQFQRLRQQQVQAPQTPPTIKDELDMMDQQQQMQAQAPMAQQGNIQQMQAPAPMAQPMDQGLGAIDAGQMEYPQFAGGGIVAFSNGDLVEDEVKRILEKAPYQRTAQENEILRRAGIELFRRELGEDSLVSRANRFLAGIPQAIRTTVSPFGYLSEEELAQQGGTGVINERIIRALGGEQLKPAAPQTPAVARPQSAVPGEIKTPFASPAEAGVAFDQSLIGAQRNVRQDAAPSAPASSAGDRAQTSRGAATGAGSRSGAATDPFVNLIEEERKRKFESIPDTFSGEERARIEKALSGLSSEKKDAVRMALAQAGFSMAAAASRAGRQRTTGLGALAEGAIGGLQQYNAAQKELRQTERELNKEMSMLRRYEDEVARGERTAQRAFEEKRAGNIADLTAKSEQLKFNQAQLAQQLKIANIRATGNERLADQLMGMYDAMDKETDPVKKAQLAQAFESRLAASERIIRSTTAGGVSTGTRESIAIQNAVEAAKEGNAYRTADRAYNTAMRAGDTAAAERAYAARQKVLMDARRQAESILGVGGSSGYVPTMGGGAYQGPYANLSNEEIMRQLGQ